MRARQSQEVTPSVRESIKCRSLRFSLAADEEKKGGREREPPDCLSAVASGDNDTFWEEKVQQSGGWTDGRTDGRLLIYTNGLCRVGGWTNREGES